MGQNNSKLVEPMLEYCEKFALESKKCMNKYNYDRELYLTPCKPQFEEYKECKRRWMEIRKIIMRGEGSMPEEPEIDAGEINKI